MFGLDITDEDIDKPEIKLSARVPLQLLNGSIKTERTFIRGLAHHRIKRFRDRYDSRLDGSGVPFQFCGIPVPVISFMMIENKRRNVCIEVNRPYDLISDYRVFHKIFTTEGIFSFNPQKTDVVEQSSYV
jgi:hypothetical protein